MSCLQFADLAQLVEHERIICAAIQQRTALIPPLDKLTESGTTIEKQIQ